MFYSVSFCFVILVISHLCYHQFPSSWDYFLVTLLFRPCAYYQSPEPAVLPKSFAQGYLCYFVSGFEIQLKINESVAPQDAYGKISNEQDVAGFKKSDSSLSILHKIWEYHDVDYQNKNHKRSLR